MRGPGVITEYAEGDKADAIDADGWLETGDLGSLDQDGYLFLAGRSDDVINRGGEKIYPREIEEFLLTQPGVRSAVVVAVRDEVLGQQPVAYVVPATDPPLFSGSGGPDLADALRAACEAELPRPKRADRVLPGTGAAPRRHGQGFPAQAAGTSRGARLTLAYPRSFVGLVAMTTNTDERSLQR